MSHKLTTEDFLKKAQKIHGVKYDYSKVEYKGAHEKVCIICHEKDENGVEHGEFWQTPHMHANSKQGCPKCGIIRNSNRQRKTTKQFIKDAIKVHGNKYDYSKVVYPKNNKIKVEILCKKTWLIFPNSP